MGPSRAIVDLRYHLECLNPFQRHVHVRRAPLGLRFEAHKRDVVGRVIYKQGAHEPALTAWMIERFQGATRPLQFVDIGANMGYFSCILARLAGAAGRVTAFEPEPENQRLLLLNLDLNGIRNVTLMPCALGAQDGVATLHKYKRSNRGRHSMVDGAGGNDIEVPVRRLDDVLDAGDPAEIDLIKIDIEGYEPFALEGASRTLARTRALVMEYSPHLLRMTAVDPAAFLARTLAHFDRLSVVAPGGVRPSTVAQCLRSADQLDLVFEKFARPA